jgi:RecB family exonuclease
VSVLCLVPTALRAARATRRLCDAEGGVLFGARVTTPDALAPGLLAAAAERRALLTPLAERLLVLEAAAAAGGPFAALEPQGGLARALAAAVAELRAGDVGSAQVRAAAADLGEGGRRLAAVADVLTAYEARLDEVMALDRAEALRVAVGAIRRGVATDELRELDLLVVEGFSALSPAAFDLVASLAHRARRTHARVPFFPERPEPCAAAEPLLRRLEGLHEIAAQREVTIALEDIDAGGARAPRLARVLQAVAGGATAAAAERGDGRVLAVAGAGEDGEAEAIARLAGDWIDGGIEAGDVLVLAASPAAAAPRLARAFAARGVPFASGRGPALHELPPVQAVRAALAAAEAPDRSALEAVAGSPYLGLAAPPARLAYLLDRAGALDGRGDPEEALRRRAATVRSAAAASERAALLRAADALAALRGALRMVASPGSPRQHTARLRALLLAAGARRRAARAEPDVSGRDLAALARVEEVADDVAQALALLGRGGEALPAARWRALLELALSEAAGPLPPEPASGAVELWPLTAAPGLSARAAIVVGCVRGGFPAPPPPEPLLRDVERAAVQRVAGRAAIASGPARRAEALHQGFCALAAGREALALAWPAGGARGGAGPAPLALEALVAAGAELPTAVAMDPPLAACRSEAEALRAVARAARTGGADGAAATRALPPGLRLRAEAALARGGLEHERRRAVLERRPAPAAGAVPEALLPVLEGVLPAEWSPSLLERHARCPYRLFASVALGLTDPDAADLDVEPRDEGELTHAVLERFLKGRLARGALPLRGAPDEVAELRARADEVCAAFEADGRTGDPAVWPARRAALRWRLERVLRAEVDAGEGAVPALLEYRFGGRSGVPPLVLRAAGAAGAPSEVLMRGRIDRVDASPERLVVLDYKDSRANTDWKQRLAREALGDTNFQVPAYLLAAARALPGRARLEATYLLLRSAERLDPVILDARDPLLALDAAAPEGEEHGRFAAAVVGAVRRIRAGEFPVASRDCSGCAFGAVCRFESVAEGVTP